MRKEIIDPTKEYQGEIKIEGHEGTWYVISSGYYRCERAFLLEHEEHGDEAPSLIVNKFGDILKDNVWNGFNELRD